MSDLFQPTLPAARSLLHQSNLPTRDLTANAMRYFVASGNAEQLSGVAGLELHPPFGLLRSLAIKVDARGRGLGKILVSAIEEMAMANRIQALYLLTTTAEQYFKPLGYFVVQRESVPRQIQQTAEFSGLCPGDAVVMAKTIKS